MAFGYANLNDDDMAEWGYISIKELLENGATLDRTWEPCTYREARERIRRDKERTRDDTYGRYKRMYFGKAKQPSMDDFR